MFFHFRSCLCQISSYIREFTNFKLCFHVKSAIQVGVLASNETSNNANTFESHLFNLVNM
jgi:hypothetical protein